MGDRVQALKYLHEAKLHGVPQFHAMRDDPRLHALARDADFQALWK